MSSLFFLSAALVFFCIFVFFFFKLNIFEKASTALILVACLFTFFQNNLFYILLGIETLLLIYSTLIASKGNVKGAVVYAACSFAVATAIAALIPHDLSFTADNTEFLHLHDVRRKLFGGLLFLFAGGLIVVPVIRSAYVSAGAPLLPFFSIFTYTLPLVLMRKIGIGHSEFLFFLSFFILLYAFYGVIVEEKLLDALMANQIGQVGFTGIIFHCSIADVYSYIVISSVYQLVLHFVCSVFLRLGVDTFTKAARFGFPLLISLFVLFTTISTSFSVLLNSCFPFQDSWYGAQITAFFLQILFTSVIPVRLLHCCYATDRRINHKTFKVSLGERFCVACICPYLFFTFTTWVRSFSDLFVVPVVMLGTATLYFLLGKVRVLVLEFSALLWSGLLAFNRTISRMKKRLFFLRNAAVQGLPALSGSVIPTACVYLDSLSLSIVIFLMSIVVVLFLLVGV